MNKEQVVELRRFHESYNMSVFRTEGIVHHENNERAHIIWDDKLEIAHSIDTNPSSFSDKRSCLVHSFNYESITGIYSKRNPEELKKFLDQIKAAGVITQDEYDIIFDDYDPEAKKRKEEELGK